MTLEEFCQEWILDIKDGNPSTIELGNRFARKLVTQWLDIDEGSDDILYCDGSGDGGIDIACINRGESVMDDGSESGDTWYLVQSKYGKAFAGSRTLYEEGQKIIDTLDGKHKNLSSIGKDTLERLLEFKDQASDRDKLTVVFATEKTLNQDQKRALDDIRVLGRNRLGGIFDVEAISIATIYQRLQDSRTIKIRIPVKTQDTKADKLIVGSVKLYDFYKFMKTYYNDTGDLDQLYEKNVRRFLGIRRKVNTGIKQTLEHEPENFGLYNNGVTIVVKDFHKSNKGYILSEPFIVNGCQTTKTIWEVLLKKLESGGTGNSTRIAEWKEKLDQGVVIVKIVKVGSEGEIIKIGSEDEKLLTRITRYTNSQNAVKEKDFLALTSDFRTWREEMEKKYKIFLEIQRGGWDSQKALQRKSSTRYQFKEWTNAFDLFKVYSAGWLGEAGLAFGKNAPFLPNGAIFKKIMNKNEENEPLGVDDLYASFLLYKNSNEKYQFGRNGIPTRRVSRFLFYMIVIELLKSVMSDAKIEKTYFNITQTLLKLFKADDSSAWNILFDTAIQLVDEYMNEENEESIYHEPDCLNKSKDIKGYIASEQFGKSKTSSPKLYELLAIHKRTMKRPSAGTLSPFDLILKTIS